MRLAEQTITLYAGDDLPAFAGVVEDHNGVAKDLTGATTYLQVRHPGGTVDEYECTINNATAGTVSFDWTGVQTLAWGVGVHDLTVRAAWAADALIAPPDRNCRLVIRPEIGNV
jgi:hypothetical protein